MRYNYKTGVIVPFAQKFYKQMTIVVAGLFLATFAAATLGVSAATNNVTPSNLNGWVAKPLSGGTYSFVNDPTSPLPAGALQLSTNGDANAYIKMQTAQDTPLASVNNLKYSTKQISAADATNGNASFRINLALDGGNDVNEQLIFEPYYNGFTGGTTWREYNLLAGKYWSNIAGKTYNSSLACGGCAGTYASNFTLADVLKDYPNAKVLAISVSMGTDNYSQIVNVDNVQFNSMTYNFENATAAPTVTVTINKYVDGAQATATTANSAAFPMVSTWDTDNIGDGTGTYTLSTVGYDSPKVYEAVTSAMSLGSNYTTNEITGGSVVSATCNGTAPFALVGYTTGDTLAAAQTGAPSTTVPALTNLQGNKYIIVWNKTCKYVANAEQCKNNGWMLGLADGRKFKNQGDCVSYFATGMRNAPAGNVAPTATRRR